MGSHLGKQVRHKLLFDEAESMLTARLAAFLLEPKVQKNLELDVATCMEMIAAARRSTGQGKAVVSKLLEQAGKIRAGKTLNINVVKALRGVITGLREKGFTGNPLNMRCVRQDKTTCCAPLLSSIFSWPFNAAIGFPRAYLLSGCAMVNTQMHASLWKTLSHKSKFWMALRPQLDCR
jgi:hypothetical protein